MQDADRLDALGSIGIVRAFTVGGSEKRRLYNNKDPFCLSRKPDDKDCTLDHFYKKLLRLESMMNTKTAKLEAKRRIKFMNEFLAELKR
ncbi:MAG: phosphohydrolase, partial [Nitrosopumilaceae archaeon]|nr:phosphohydrolase [Nitrosopumilaceae archaeon]